MKDRMEIIARTERRREFSDAEKATILAEADADGVSVRQVAERHEIAESLRRAAAKRPASVIRSPWSVQKIDALFAIERDINVSSAAVRLAAHQEYSAPLMAELKDWLGGQLAKLSRSHDLAKAINYMLRRWDAFTRFLDDGRVCLSNNAAERALRCVPLGRKAWLFCGSDRGGQRAAIAYALIQTCRLNDIDPQAWLADVLARIANHPIASLDELLPWKWQPRFT